ncbi:pleckstrin homology domain-containing family O member 1b isoform X4 [Neoarius graeffei]|uniref:pleckstrin homology domain-containing family O member 1b isoform X4 n=1 Tax=Neoarius graeffei TaxID=443677 RepID=UPI00298C1A06|nr:pleckstrin homology domain-containing family O member 1b isoform X4 [Neoarius graeffei]
MMKKNNSAKRALQDSSQQPAQPDKVGWIRKYCGKGLFREIWKNRYVVLKGDKLYISEKEVKDEKKIQEVVDLTDYERSEELRKAKSRTKKNHSKFTLLCARQPGNTVPDLVFLAVSPEEKESWINALNIAITRGKNRILDEVTVEGESCLVHPTRDRAKIPHTRRLPTRGHLLAVASASTSDGMLTLDLIQEEDTPSPEAQDQSKSANSRMDTCQLLPDCEDTVKSQSLPRKSESSWTWCESQAQTPRAGKKFRTTDKNRCASMDEILSHSDTKRSIPHCSASAPAHSICQLQELISLKLERTQDLLSEVRGHSQGCGADSASGKEAERLLEEAASAWGQARDVLEEVKEIRVLCRQLEEVSCPSDKLKSPQQNQFRKSLM